ncbi:MAG: 4-hydroxy-tetrahydrodipicolinate synthase [Eubacteriales bacterium]|nr:4-hydroxy-tetrahydrodipicolinate synthase [Eubacteriales bacterium]MDY5440536.1 4-hydroxy-tetrahydrodipicolinate synthase [Eubacteriales bacterium]
MIFEGVGTALITPFNENGVDFESLERIVNDQITAGVNALIVCGTTGEPATMTEQERISAVKCVVETTAGRVPVIAGAGSNSTATAISNCQKYEALGVDGLLIVTPYYNKCTQKGLIAHYEAIAKSTTLPIIVYNVPGRTGVNILPETLDKIADIPNVVAIKEASGKLDQVQKMLDLCKDRIDVYSGEDNLAVEIVKMGGKGLISVLSNVVPSKTATMLSLALKGEYELADALQKDVNPLVDQLFVEVNPIPVKKAMELMGYCKKYIRLPLTEMEDEHTEKLKELLIRQGVL